MQRLEKRHRWKNIAAGVLHIQQSGLDHNAAVPQSLRSILVNREELQFDHHTAVVAVAVAETAAVAVGAGQRMNLVARV